MADTRISAADLAELVSAVRARTPARLLVGRSGPAYRTATQLGLRVDHAAARDAVHAELDLARDLGPELIDPYRLFGVTTRAQSKQQYLLDPELGRHLSEDATAVIRESCPAQCDLQIVIGDGLSATAVRVQVPGLLPLLMAGAAARGWRTGRPFVITHCRVGLLNDIGELLDPAVVVLLIGERPGLATAESLSAYMAFRPRAGHTDAQRNLISNIHGRGVGHEEAAQRILALAATMMRLETSGVKVKEERANGADNRSAPGNNAGTLVRLSERRLP